MAETLLKYCRDGVVEGAKGPFHHTPFFILERIAVKENKNDEREKQLCQFAEN